MCGVYLLFGVYSKRFTKCVLKCTPIILLLFQMLVVLIDRRLASTATSSENHREKIATIMKFILGLAFSAIGDACLVFPKVFIIGLISFGISLCIYINVLQVFTSLSSLTLGGVIAGVCVYGLYIFLLVFILKQNSIIRAKAPPGMPGRLMAFVALYFMMLSTLLWSGLLLLLRESSYVGITTAAGAALFYISDLLIAADALWKLRLLQGRALVMLTYYSAQLLLAISLTI